MTQIETMGQKAKSAARVLAVAGEELKNRALLAIADALEENSDKITAANAVDMENGEKAGLSQSLLDRLLLNPDRVCGMAQGIRSVASQPDPIGRVLTGTTLPNGLKIEKVTVPLLKIGQRRDTQRRQGGYLLKQGNSGNYAAGGGERRLAEGLYSSY